MKILFFAFLLFAVVFSPFRAKSQLRHKLLFFTLSMWAVKPGYSYTVNLYDYNTNSDTITFDFELLDTGRRTMEGTFMKSERSFDRVMYFHKKTKKVFIEVVDNLGNRKSFNLFLTKKFNYVFISGGTNEIRIFKIREDQYFVQDFKIYSYYVNFIKYID